MQEIERETAPDRQCAADFPLIFTPPHILAVLNLAVVVVTPSSDPGSLVENREKVCRLLRDLSTEAESHLREENACTNENNSADFLPSGINTDLSSSSYPSSTSTRR